MKLIGKCLVISALFVSLFFYLVKDEQQKEVKDEHEGKQVLNLSEERLEESSLPIVVIQTNGQEIVYTKKGESNGEKIEAQLSLYLPEDFSQGHLYPVLESTIEIGVRGNTTRLLPKKQYGFTLLNEAGEEKSKSLLGMPKNSQWILNASFEDKSLMRNKLAYDVAGYIMEYAPRSEFCEVYLVDDNQALNEEQYMGVYLLVEKIEQSDSRVNIQSSLDNVPETSFIVAKNRSKPTDTLLSNYGFETYLYDYPVMVEYPIKNLTEAKVDYINQTISQFERILYSDVFNDPLVGYEAYIDSDSFVDYFIINEFFKNTDAGVFSTYLYKDYESKIKAGPVWDFDSAMGNSAHLFPYFDADGLYMPQTAWFEQLVKDERFVKRMIERYKILRLTYLSDDYLLKQIDLYTTELEGAARRNFERWPIELCNQTEMFKKYYDVLKVYEKDVNALLMFFEENPQYAVDTSSRARSFSREVELLKKFIVERSLWLDENIESLLKWAES